MPPYFGATVYDDPAVYARSSPIAFIKQSHTPTLMLVGELDTDCPPSQSRELWQALRTLDVPAQLVVYPQEAHGFSQAEHRRDRVERIFDWFNRHMPAR
jgi:dipeptidyl aminopeptidase/acylaminoacyl peptidase